MDKDYFNILDETLAELLSQGIEPLTIHVSPLDYVEIYEHITKDYELEKIEDFNLKYEWLDVIANEVVNDSEFYIIT